MKLFSYPCIQLLCSNDFMNSIKDRFFQQNNNETNEITTNEEFNKVLNEDLFGEIESEELKDFTGLLNSLKFEVFVKKCAKIERNWPASFRTWFVFILYCLCIKLLLESKL